MTVFKSDSDGFPLHVSGIPPAILRAYGHYVRKGAIAKRLVAFQTFDEGDDLGAQIKLSWGRTEAVLYETYSLESLLVDEPKPVERDTLSRSDFEAYVMSKDVKPWDPSQAGRRERILRRQARAGRATVTQRPPKSLSS